MRYALKLRAVIAGWVVDSVPPLLTAAIILVCIVVEQIRVSGSLSSSELIYFVSVLSSKGVLLVSAAVEALWYLVGGYVAARLARENEITNSLVSALLAMFTGILMATGSRFSVPIWYYYSVSGLDLFGAAVGGCLGRVVNARYLTQSKSKGS